MNFQFCINILLRLPALGMVVVLCCLLTLSMVFDNGLCGFQQDRWFRFCANLFSCYLLTTVICGRMVEKILSTVPVEF